MSGSHHTLLTDLDTIRSAIEQYLILLDHPKPFPEFSSDAIHIVLIAELDRVVDSILHTFNEVN